jgi:hypothetical protein
MCIYCLGHLSPPPPSNKYFLAIKGEVSGETSRKWEGEEKTKDSKPSKYIIYTEDSAWIKADKNSCPHRAFF